MNKRSLGFLAASCGCVAVLWPAGLSARELLVKTVDAFTGAPVPGMTVQVSLGDESSDGVSFTRTSDGSGAFRLRRRSFQKASFFVEETDRNYATVNLRKDFKGKADVEFSVPVALKGTPAKLKIAKAKLKFPEGSDSIGYDLLRGEMLPPEGRGEVADIEFRRMPRVSLGMAHDYRGKPTKERMKDTLLVRFPGEGNGIQDMTTVPQCHLWVRTAPETGYRQAYESIQQDGERMEPILTSHFQKAQCFRIRTRTDDSGGITNCFYGKIYGEFEWRADYHNPPFIKELSFCYYLNETPLDRNLEKDYRDGLLHDVRP